MTTFAALVVGLALSVNSRGSAAQPAAAPYELQAAMFAKIFNYDKRIRKPGGKYKVVIVSSDKYGKQAKSLSSGFKTVKVETTFADPGDLPDETIGASAVYVFGTEHAEAIEKLCYRQKVLSISGVPALADDGRVSVAIGLKDDRLQIIIHLNRAKKEGHSFSSHLLKLAKIIR